MVFLVKWSELLYQREEEGVRTIIGGPSERFLGIFCSVSIRQRLKSDLLRKISAVFTPLEMAAEMEEIFNTILHARPDT